MTILPIILAPDPLLKQTSEPVTEITDAIRTLAADMLETMYASNGIGLAAVQVGRLKRLIVADVKWESPRYREEGEARDAEPKPGEPLVLINPEILEESSEICPYDEGCLSFPGQYSTVERPAMVRIQYMDLEGNIQILEADGLLATCLQHEVDHMNGVVFVDHVSKLKRDMIMRKVKKEKKRQEEV